MISQKKPRKKKITLGTGIGDIGFNPNRTELLTLLNKHPDRNLCFWEDKNGFGDIVGLVPLERFYEKKRGSIYFEYKDIIWDTCYKFVVINLPIESKDFQLNINDAKKKNILSKSGMIYLKHHDINFIYQEVLNIK